MLLAKRVSATVCAPLPLPTSPCLTLLSAWQAAAAVQTMWSLPSLLGTLLGWARPPPLQARPREWWRRAAAAVAPAA